VRVLNNKIGIILFSVFFLFGCSSGVDLVEVSTNESNSTLNQEDEDVKQGSQLTLPDRVDLSYSEMAPSNWNQETDTSAWTHHNSLHFGLLDGEDVVLDLFLDEGNDVHGVLRYSNKEFKILHIGYNPDEVQVESLNQIFYRENEKVELVGFIESGGRYYYLIYENQEWSILDTWAKPYLADIDKDGTLDIISQFEGRGMNFPDVTIMKWDGIDFVGTSIRSHFSSLDVSTAGIMLAFEYFHEDNNLFIKVTPIGEDEYPSIQYRFEDNSLILIKE
jgi:hypothetical protein